MPVRPAAQRRKALSMTSLIDVIFLLLLFFMLSSTFTKFSEIKLSGATAGRTGAPSGQAPLFLRLSDEAAQLNGRDYALPELAEAIAELRSGEVQKILIAPQDDAVTAQRLVDVLVALASVPELDVVVLE